MFNSRDITSRRAFICARDITLLEQLPQGSEILLTDEHKFMLILGLERNPYESPSGKRWQLQPGSRWNWKYWNRLCQQVIFPFLSHLPSADSRYIQILRTANQVLWRKEIGVLKDPWSTDMNIGIEDNVQRSWNVLLEHKQSMLQEVHHQAPEREPVISTDVSVFNGNAGNTTPERYTRREYIIDKTWHYFDHVQEIPLETILTRLKDAIHLHDTEDRRLCVRRMPGIDFQSSSLHKDCVQYRREEVIISPFPHRATIFLYSTPSHGETCVVCGRNMEVDDRHRMFLFTYPILNSPQRVPIIHTEYRTELDVYGRQNDVQIQYIDEKFGPTKAFVWSSSVLRTYFYCAIPRPRLILILMVIIHCSEWRGTWSGTRQNL